ncbi:hypothetical protein O181_105439, partial [Austropuccinia psidii MF-1]|nr:hypothetical protein [Austropuccinia psidii MF-1]
MSSSLSTPFQDKRRAFRSQKSFPHPALKFLHSKTVTGALRSEEGLALSKLGLTYGGLKDM